MSEAKATPGPWEARNVSGAGWEVRGVLPAGFKFDATHYEADGKTSFQTWVMASPATVLVACERWVQFETEQWSAMQAANAHLISAAPDLFAACETALKCLIDLAPYPPEVTEGVVGITAVVHAAIQKARGTP